MTSVGKVELKSEDKQKIKAEEANLSDKTKTTIDDVSQKISILIEHGTSINTQFDNYKEVQNAFEEYLIRALNAKRKKDLLKSYFKKEEKVEAKEKVKGEEYSLNLNKEKVHKKVEKNLMIYLPILTKHIYEIKGNIEIRTSEGLNLIEKSIKKMLIILFIYGDKTSLNLVSNMMKLDLDELKQKEKDFNIRLGIAEKSEINTMNNFLKLPTIDLNYLEDDPEKNINGLYSKFLRTLTIKTDEKLCHKNKTDYIELDVNKIEKDIALKELNITIKEFYNVFIKTIELNDHLNRRLSKIYNSFIKIYGLINLLKELNIFDKDYTIINDSNKHIFENELFIKFVLGIDSKNNYENDNNIINNIVNDIKSKKEEKKEELKQKKEKSSATLNIDNIKNNWNLINSDERYKFFVENLFHIQNNKLKVNNISTLFSEKNKSKLVKYFYDKKSKKDNKSKKRTIEENKLKSKHKNEVLSKIEKLKNINYTSIEDFINNDLDTFIFLYESFELITTNGNITNKSDLLVDTINKLKSEGKLDNDLEINTGKSLYNLSAVNIGLQLQLQLESLSKGTIELESFSIGKTISKHQSDEKNELLFKDSVKLYNKSADSDYEDSIAYLDNAIDTCIQILNSSITFDEAQAKYIKILKELEILPDDISNITMKDKDNIIQLIYGLKLVKNKSEILKKMQDISKSDKDISKIIYNKISEDDSHTTKLGPEKHFGRTLVKFIKKYNGDFHKIGDLNRMRIDCNGNSINDAIEKVILLKDLEGVKDIFFDNSVGHYLSSPIIVSGYRDIKADILLESGNILELQIHFEEMVNVKCKPIILDNSVKKLISKQETLLDSDDVNKFIEIYIDEFGQIPSNEILLNISNLNESEIRNLKLNEKKTFDGKDLEIGDIHCDKLYNISRKLIEGSILEQKLKKIERILFNREWSKIILNHFREVGINLK